jgi:DNA-directed RNA polymerase specialized sigma24 family protein
MPTNRATAELIVSLSAGSELAPEPYALLSEIISKVSAALRSRYQPADIEDAIAEALLLLAQKPDLYREKEGSLAGFVYVIARNVAARRGRLLANETPTDPELLLRTVEEKERGADGGEIGMLPETKTGELDRRKQALAEQLGKLSVDQQHILSAFAEAREGEPWAARHARRTGDDPNRVRVRLHRLIRKLRKEIGWRVDGT